MIEKKYFEEVVLANGKIKAISINLKSIDDLGNILEYIKDDLISAKRIIIIFTSSIQQIQTEPSFFGLNS